MSRKPPLYDTWYGMHARCRTPSNNSFKYYGGKGIAVCERWSDYRDFAADMGPRPERHTLDRIDSTKGYSPENCRWATVQEQNSHKGDTQLHTLNGDTLPLKQWARRVGLSYQVLYNRVTKLRIPLADALTLPVGRGSTLRYLKEIK